MVLTVKKKKSKKASVKRSARPVKTKASKPVKSKTARPTRPVKTNASRSANTDKSMTLIIESTKTVSKEIKTISKIFTDNQKILESMKTMITTLSGTMQHIDRHSKQIMLLENESQKIQADLRQVNQKAESVKPSGAINGNIEKRLVAIENESNFVQVKEIMSECLKITKTSGQTLDKISDYLNSASNTNADNIESKLDANAKMLDDVRKHLYDHVQDGADKNIKNEISEKISTISREIAGLREQIRSVSDAQITDELTDHMSAISSKAEVLMGIPAELLEMQSRLNSIEGKIAEKKDSSEKQPSITLLEYQVKIRMNSESKYGDTDELQSMIDQTSEVLQTIEKNKSTGISKWGVSRILECADRWELRFSDVLAMMKDTLGADILKEAIRIKQVKDVYGVRAVEDTKSLLGLD